MRASSDDSATSAMYAAPLLSERRDDRPAPLFTGGPDDGRDDATTPLFTAGRDVASTGGAPTGGAAGVASVAIVSTGASSFATSGSHASLPAPTSRSRDKKHRRHRHRDDELRKAVIERLYADREALEAALRDSERSREALEAALRDSQRSLAIAEKQDNRLLAEAPLVDNRLTETVGELARLRAVTELEAEGLKRRAQEAEAKSSRASAEVAALKNEMVRDQSRFDRLESRLIETQRDLDQQGRYAAMKATEVNKEQEQRRNLESHCRVLEARISEIQIVDATNAATAAASFSAEIAQHRQKTEWTESKLQAALRSISGLVQARKKDQGTLLFQGQQQYAQLVAERDAYIATLLERDARHLEQIEQLQGIIPKQLPLKEAPQSAGS